MLKNAMASPYLAAAARVAKKHCFSGRKKLAAGGMLRKFLEKIFRWAQFCRSPRLFVPGPVSDSLPSYPSVER